VSGVTRSDDAEVMSPARLFTVNRLDGLPDRPSPSRSPFLRDYDRIIFCGSFRRLADKTQIFPLPTDDHVHSRLTHSLEVASIGRSLGAMVGEGLAETGRLPDSITPRDAGDAVAAACLAHDLGNPPFGHVGEDVIREFFTEHRDTHWFAALPPHTRSDLLAFEGNAQAFAIVTRIEKASPAHGLNLSALTLGALLKYPCGSGATIPGGPPHRKKHGFQSRDVAMMRALAGQLGLRPEDSTGTAWARHPLAFLTEAADDIAYQILDLEDGLRLNLVPRPLYQSTLAAICEGAKHIDQTDLTSLGRQDMLRVAGHNRAVAVGRLVKDAAAAFMANAAAIFEGTHDRALKKDMTLGAHLATVETLNVRYCYGARDVLKMEIAGTAAIKGVLDALARAARGETDIQSRHLRALLPDIVTGEATVSDQILRVTDHVAGMTDSYILRLYRELTGIRLPGDRE
jgi:dGTPase